MTRKDLNHPSFEVSISVSVSVMVIIRDLESIWLQCLPRELNSVELHSHNHKQNSVVVYFQWEQ